MAARLVRRCCWRHFAAFVSAPSAATAALLVPPGKVPTPRALPQAPLALFHTSSPPDWADGFSVKEQVDDGRNPEYKVIGELIETATSPQELFQLSELHELNSNHASLIITQISRLASEKKLETENIVRDERFQQLIGIMDSQVWNNTLVNLLKSLYSLGVPSSRREMQSVEQEVLWRLRRLTFRQLASLAEFLAIKQGKDNKLLNEVIKKLELRWTELEGTRTVALELAEHFNPDETRKILLALAYQNRRCVPLLRALSYHLLQKHAELSLSVLLDLVFAYGKLNFHQPQVFQKIASDLQPHVPAMAPMEVTRCTRSFALLKWLSLPLFEAITQYALDNPKQLSVAHLCGIILSFARLNFQPSGSEDFFNMVTFLLLFSSPFLPPCSAGRPQIWHIPMRKQVHEELQGQLGSLEPQMLTELVWSLHDVLLCYRTVHVLRLKPQELMGELGDRSLKAQNLQLKLIHINAAAKLENPDYKGPFLPPELLSTVPLASERVTQLQSCLREALTGLLGSQDNGRFDVRTLYGWHIDAEMVVTSENKPLPVKDFAAPHLLRAEGTKPLPPGARRWVPHYEFLELKLERQRTAYLRDKLHKVMAKDMAS
ncbi:Tbrg4 [Columba guinea]|nr:Tbrg4 [Columba guinea]